MTLLAEHGGAQVWHATWRELLPIVEAAGGCDALVVDAPYSAKTHSGHDDGAEQARFRPKDERRLRTDKRDGTVYAVGANRRRSINYLPWTDDDVCAFVDAWAPLVRGWIVSITDHTLAQSWAGAYEVNERLSFQPVPLIERGMTVRLCGGGPSSWATYAMVSRPRTMEWARWSTLDGGYSGPTEKKPVTGGKPLWLMHALVRDYTRPGDLVVDPCCGAGTTLLAARLEGRRAIGGDAMLEHAELAAERIRALPTHEKRGTLALFGGDR
jgi:site-specific DNA-methyltransferase (adenine-specific)